MEPNDKQKTIVAGAAVVPEPKPLPKKTTIQILKATADDLTSCKSGNDTYDDVINRHMNFWKDKNPQRS